MQCYNLLAITLAAYTGPGTNHGVSTCYTEPLLHTHPILSLIEHFSGLIIIFKNE